MVRIGRVEYDVRVGIIIGVDMTVYVVISASVAIVSIIFVVVILSRDVVLIGLVLV